MNTKVYCTSVTAILCMGFAAAAAEVRGVIVKMDPKNHELVIEGRGRGLRGSELTFMLDKETAIFSGKDPAKESDLTPGKRVRIVYERQAGERVAVRITVHGAALAELAKQAPGEGIKPAVNDPNTISGVLRRVAQTDREIVVFGSDKETTIFVPESAKITRDQKTIRLEDLKEGNQVAVQIEKKDGHETIARSIQVGAVVTSAKMPGPRSRSDGIDTARRVLKIIESFLDNVDRR